MEIDSIEENLDEQYIDDYRTFHETLDQMNTLFKNDLNASMPNKGSISFRTPIPHEIQNAYNGATQNLVYFLHKNLEDIINKQSSSTHIQNQNVRQLTRAINELDMAIFFSPIPEDKKILDEYRKKIKTSLKYLFKNLSQANVRGDYENGNFPFLPSILRLFTFTVILYAIVKGNKLDSFLSKMVNPEENGTRLIYFHAQDIDSLIQNFLQTPNQYSIRYHSEIKKMSQKLENLLKSMEVYKGEFVAKPLNEEIEYKESDHVRQIYLGKPVFDKKSEKNVPPLNEDDLFTHLDHLYATKVKEDDPYGELLNIFDSCSIKKRPNKENYILFDKDEVSYYQFH